MEYHNGYTNLWFLLYTVCYKYSLLEDSFKKSNQMYLFKRMFAFKSDKVKRKSTENRPPPSSVVGLTGHMYFYWKTWTNMNRNPYRLANQKQALSQVAGSTFYGYSLCFWSNFRQKYKPSKYIHKYHLYILYIYILIYLTTMKPQPFVL